MQKSISYVGTAVIHAEYVGVTGARNISWYLRDIVLTAVTMIPQGSNSGRIAPMGLSTEESTEARI